MESLVLARSAGTYAVDNIPNNADEWCHSGSHSTVIARARCRLGYDNGNGYTKPTPPRVWYAMYEVR
jgi:hypothetical protein